MRLRIAFPMHIYRPAAVLFLALGLIVAPSVLADTHYAARNGQTETSPYTNGWASAASNIQDAVNQAGVNDTVLVGAGRYTLPPNATNYMGSNVVYINKSLTLRSSNSVPATTIIDGEGTNRGITIFAPFVLDGFTISNCFATNQGGGILIIQATGNGEMRNCIITDNSVGLGTKAEGGGVWAGYTTPLAYNSIISNCTFRNNRALSSSGVGGGFYVSTYIGCTLTTDSLFENNSANNGGGMKLQRGGSGYGLAHTIERCVIRGNLAGGNYGGGGVHCGTPCKVVMRSCLMYENRATSGYGGAFTHEDNSKVTTQEFYNCTIASNMAPSGGGGIFVRDWTSVPLPCPVVIVYNTIVCSNGIDNISMKAPPDCTNIFMNSCSFPSNANFRMLDTGNITNSPRFIDFAGKNFRLPANSPCVNAGTNFSTGTLDLDGKTRIRYGRVDMGAYEAIYRGTLYGVR